MQASFDPPGLTVAVKKDRAVENLLNGGSQFVVNILAEGDHKTLMKQLLKSFKPGEDRFAGLDIQVTGGWSCSCRLTSISCSKQVDITSGQLAAKVRTAIKYWPAIDLCNTLEM